MVSLVLFTAVLAGLIAFWQRRIMLVSAFCHLRYLVSMAGIKLFYAVFKTHGLGMVAVRFVFTHQRANYAVKFCVFTQQVLAVKI
jgi:hypothetical protein